MVRALHALNALNFWSVYGRNPPEAYLAENFTSGVICDQSFASGCQFLVEILSAVARFDEKFVSDGQFMFEIPHRWPIL